MVAPGMSDGRCFTNYTSNCLMNANIMKKLDISDTHKYRQYLQQHTSELLKTFETVCADHCADCIHQPLKHMNPTQ